MSSIQQSSSSLSLPSSWTKYYMVSQGSAEIYTDHNSKVSLLMLYATHDVFSEEYDTYCRFVTTECGSKQVALHQIGNMQLCVVATLNNNNNNTNDADTPTMKQQQNNKKKKKKKKTTVGENEEENQLENSFQEEEEEEEGEEEQEDDHVDISSTTTTTSSSSSTLSTTTTTTTTTTKQYYSMNGETHAALFRQLCLLHDLVCFRIPVKPNQNLHNMSLNQTQTQRLLHPLVQTMKRMTMTHQSLLVQGIEYVELGTFLRDDVTEAIQKVMKSHRYILHAVLFVGTKLVTVCSRPRSWVLSPRDLLCLLIYTESVFHVVSAEEEHERLHEQQQQQHEEEEEEEEEAQKQQQKQQKQAEEEDGEDGEEATEEEEETKKRDDAIFASIMSECSSSTSPISSSPTSDSLADSFHSMNSNSLPIHHPNHDIHQKQQQQQQQQSDQDQDQPDQEEEEDDMYPDHGAGEEDGDDDLETFNERDHMNENSSEKIPDAVFDNLFFQHPSNKLVQCGVFSKYDRENNITLILIYDPAMEKAAKAAQQQQQQQQKQQQQQQQTSTQQEEENTSPTSPPPLEPHKQELILTQQLIFRELQNFVSFLQIKAHSHITMMHYLHYCPGIIHFIFVDRIRNRVIAPRIVSLFSSNSASGISTTTTAATGATTDVAMNRKQMEQISVQFLKKKVWEMCHLAQQYRDQGYTEMCLGGLGVQYWFKEWIEDENGNELVYSEKNIVCEPETFANARAHYELYTMYLPFVSTQAIAHYNRILTCVLLDRQMSSSSFMMNSTFSSSYSNGGGGSFKMGGIGSNNSSFSL